MEYQKIRAAFNRFLEKQIDSFSEDVQQTDLKEIVEEFEGELLTTELIGANCVKMANKACLTVPNDEDVISYKPDGNTPLSLFKDNKWALIEAKNTVTINFGQRHIDIGVDLSSPNADPLRRLQKLIAYFHVPGKAFYFRSSKIRTTQNIAAQFLHLYAYLYKNGYLLVADGEYKTLETVNVEDLKTEVRARMQREEGRHCTVNFAYSIARWALLSQLEVLPKEFRASFSPRDFWSRGFSKEVALYDARMTQGWEAIDFDDLQTMLTTANNYIHIFAPDLLYLWRKQQEAHTIVYKKGKEVSRRTIYNCGSTKRIYQEIFSHQFVENPESSKPWIEITALQSSDSAQMSKFFIDQKPFTVQWKILLGSAIFMLLLWTAMRISELRTLQADALLIDGKPFDLNMNVMQQVAQGQHFDLLRTVTKTEVAPLGKDYLIPVPPIGAQAFAILFEFFREKRERLGHNYLLPVGGLHYTITGKNDTFSNPASIGFIYNAFANFCHAAGAEHQHPHKCRKSIATLLINHNPNSLELIRDLLCHQNITMTLVYLMSLPGIAEDIKKYMSEKQRAKIIHFLEDGLDGRLAGAAGDRTLDAIMKNRVLFKGEALATTVKTLVNSLTTDSNFEIVRTPAAWCLRFPSQVPWAAPCLPSNAIPGEYPLPNPARCQPWLCRDAAHTTKDISRVKAALAWTSKAASDSKATISKAQYEVQLVYWNDVLYQLENGRPDVIDLNIIPQALAYGEQ
ncbi:site-specific integrase [Pelosinus sp. sgz500959]|uniref:site-specific integrase n=1 Tax=Pelosinus sp. sgz500959 TaxID=3242472 RepID=UPI00366A798C